MVAIFTPLSGGFFRYVPGMEMGGVDTVWTTRETEINANSGWKNIWLSWLGISGPTKPAVPQDTFFSGGGQSAHWTTLGPINGADGKRYVILSWYDNLWGDYLVNIDDKTMCPLFDSRTTNHIYPDADHTGLINWDDVFTAVATSESGDMNYADLIPYAVPNSNSFWVLSWQNTRFLAARYTITNQTTVVRAQSVYEYTPDPGGTVGRLLGEHPLNVWSDGTTAYCLTHQKGQPAHTLVYKMPMSGANVDNRVADATASRIDVGEYDDNAWQSYRTKFSAWGTRRASMVETSSTKELLMYIPTDSTNIINVDLPCPIETTSPGPRLYKTGLVASNAVGDPPTSNYTDISSLFNIPWTDAESNYAGTPTTSGLDQYRMTTFKRGTEWFVGFVKTYSDTSVYAKVRLYKWNDGAPTELYNGTFKVWNSGANETVFDQFNTIRVTDYSSTAISSSKRSGYENQTNMIQEDPCLFFDSTTDELFITMIVRNIGESQPADGYLFTQIGDFTDGPAGGACPPGIYFSDFTEDTDFKDWIITNHPDPDCDAAGEEFISFLETFYHMPEDYMLWMQSPYIYTHMVSRDNVPVVDASGNEVTTLTDLKVTSGDDYGLTLNGKWDWVI